MILNTIKEVNEQVDKRKRRLTGRICRCGHNNKERRRKDIMPQEEVSKERLSNLIEGALADVSKTTEDEIYRKIGVSMISMGLEGETDLKNKYFVKPLKNMDFKSSPSRSTDLLVGTLSAKINDDIAIKTGKDFWKVFKIRAKKYICGDEGIKKLIKEGKVKEALLRAIPPLLAAMGLTAIWIPVVTTMVVGLIMLLGKIGIGAFCGWKKG
jgi:hypothetical protein